MTDTGECFFLSLQSRFIKTFVQKTMPTNHIFNYIALGNHAQSVETNYEQHGPSKWVRYVDFLAATSLGQFFIRATLRLLHVVVNIIWWTCPRTEGILFHNELFKWDQFNRMSVAYI